MSFDDDTSKRMEEEMKMVVFETIGEEAETKTSIVFENGSMFQGDSIENKASIVFVLVENQTEERSHPPPLLILFEYQGSKKKKSIEESLENGAEESSSIGTNLLDSTNRENVKGHPSSLLSIMTFPDN